MLLYLLFLLFSILHCNLYGTVHICIIFYNLRLVTISSWILNTRNIFWDIKIFLGRFFGLFRGRHFWGPDQLSEVKKCQFLCENTLFFLFLYNYFLLNTCIYPSEMYKVTLFLLFGQNWWKKNQFFVGFIHSPSTKPMHFCLSRSLDPFYIVS